MVSKSADCIPVNGHGLGNREIAALSVYYFLFYGGVGLTIAFIPIDLKNHGLSFSQIAILSALSAAAGGLTQVLLGHFSDKLGSRIHLAVLSCVSLGLSYLFYVYANSFAEYVPLFIWSGVGSLGGLTLTQAIIADLTSNGGNTAQGFSITRIWGTFGFIASLLLVTLLPGIADNAEFLYWTAAFYVLSAIPLLFIHESPIKRTSKNLFTGAMAVLKSSRSYIFLFCFTLSRLCDAGILGYLGLYLKEMGGGTQIIATAYWLNAVAEIPFVLLTGKLAERFGLKAPLILAFAVWPIRLYLYTLITVPSSVYYIQLLHGFTFGIVLIASVAYMAKASPGDLHGTGQGLLNVANALAMAIGPLLVGFIGDAQNLRDAFIVMTAIMITALVILIVFVREPDTEIS